MARIRLAVIGVGLMGAKHAALVRAHADCTLVGLADPDPARQTVADTLAVPFYATAAELLQRQRPAGVIVATPNAQHAPVAERQILPDERAAGGRRADDNAAVLTA